MSLSADVLLKLPHSQEVYQQLVKRYPSAANVWKYFLAVCEIPHGSGNTQQIVKFLAELGKQLGAEVKVDKALNIGMRIPASKGMENKPGIILQCHHDMVCTKTAASMHNFEKDPIKCIYNTEKEVIQAEGTTLGADDGIGIACCLAMLEEHTTYDHPMIEVLITDGEEVGMEGANQLVNGELIHRSSKYLINVDNEDWGELCISAAGGAHRTMIKPVSWENVPEQDCVALEIKLTDFVGGHSGDVHVPAANAIKWMTEMLQTTYMAVPIRIISLDAGHAHNAIPSHATIVVGVPAASAEDFSSKLRQNHSRLMGQYESIETKIVKLDLTSAPISPGTLALNPTVSKNVIHLIDQCPHGIFKWSCDVANLVETSQNLCTAKLSTGAPALELAIFARSADNKYLRHVSDIFQAYCRLHDAEMRVEGIDMDGWPAKPDSHILAVAHAVFEREFGRKGVTMAYHAGLECGLIMAKYPDNDLESISIGPTVKNPHTPDEYCDLVSTVECMTLIKKMVMELSK